MAAVAFQAPDRSVLAGRIQGFGNVNPPPLDESVSVKKVASRISDVLGEEIMLTVDDFKEKGAVGAVKDAVADAGDLLIDGASAIFGWVKGEPPPPEDESEHAERAQNVLVNGPSGAAYGVQQASPSGGINAVWVMPDEADPATLAELAAQSRQNPGMGGVDPRAPKNIQPYQDPRAAPPQMPHGMTIAPYQPNGSPQGMPQIQPYQPGGPQIQPYQPGGGARAPPYIPGVSGMPGMAGMPGGYNPGMAGMPGGYNPGFLPGAGSSSQSSAGSSVSGAKSVIERVAKGEVVPGADVAKRLVAQCGATNMTAKQLAELICERARRLYLGLDGSVDADAGLVRLLGLADALVQADSKFAQDAVSSIKAGITEEFMSLQSSVKHKDVAVPMLRRVGMLSKAAAEMPDLLGGMAATPSASASPAAQTDLLGGFDPISTGCAPNPGGQTDLLGF